MARKSENVHDEVTKAEVHNIFPDLYEVTIQTKPHGGSNAKSCDGRHHANGLREIRSRFAIKKPSRLVMAHFSLLVARFP